MDGVIRRLLALTLLVFAATATAAGPVYTGRFGRTAIGGYDAVAYHLDGKAVLGSRSHVAEWNGAKWQFATAEHRQAFEASPERYAPQYGGYCAYGVGAKNDLVSSDPQAWDIVDGKLYLNYDRDVQQLWRAQRARYIDSGNRNWPTLVAR